MILAFSILLFQTISLISNIEIYWTNDYKLKFSDFRGDKKTTDIPSGELFIYAKWRFYQSDDEPPVYKLLNTFDSDKSWMSINHPELLKEYQFIWNLQELYVRKARKDILELNKNMVTDRNEYENAIKKQISKFQKQKNRYNGILKNQPDLYRIIDQKYQDSLQLYQDYKE